MARFSIRNRYLLLADIALCFLAYTFVIAAIFPLASFAGFFMGGLAQIGATAICYILIFRLLDLYQVNWVYAGVREYLRLLTGCLFAALLSVLAGMFLSRFVFFPKLNLAAAAVASALTCALRFFIRILCRLSGTRDKRDGARTLIIGAGRLAVTLLRDIQSSSLSYNVIGLVDDDLKKAHQQIHGAGVLGTRNDIERICKEQKIAVIIFAIHQILPQDKADILDRCSATGAIVKILPGMEEMLHGGSSLSKVREMAIEDLLEREPIQLDNQLLRPDISEKVILVTGGGGSIGSELCRQIANYKPKRLIILDIYENTTYELQNELADRHPDLGVDVLIASVRDKERILSIFKAYRPDIVFHAAAHKHVPLMEFNPGEAIKNNVFGTQNVVDCAEASGVRRFVMISTDKAVNPTNVMGATKRLCEMIVQSKRGKSKTEFVAVRFGNVLGSNGSVIPHFKRQIASGGPVTVTHPEITRFFMTIPEAAQLVLQAASYAKGGEIFVLDMGQPVRIYDLALKMIRLSGLRPEKDISIRFTGLRPGEKLYEELLMMEEGLAQTEHSKIFVGRPLDVDADALEENLCQLAAVVENGDGEEIKEKLAAIVPTYKRT